MFQLSHDRSLQKELSWEWGQR